MLHHSFLMIINFSYIFVILGKAVHCSKTCRFFIKKQIPVLTSFVKNELDLSRLDEMKQVKTFIGVLGWIFKFDWFLFYLFLRISGSIVISEEDSMILLYKCFTPLQFLTTQPDNE